MSQEKQKEYSYLAIILIMIIVVFMLIEVFIWTGVIKDVNGTLGNLGYGLDKLFDNPAFVGLLTTFIVGMLSGFMENWSITKEAFDGKRFAETFFYYEPLMLLFGTWLPTKYVAVFLFAVDVIRRITLRLKR